MSTSDQPECYEFSILCNYSRITKLNSDGGQVITPLTSYLGLNPAGTNFQISSIQLKDPRDVCRREMKVDQESEVKREIEILATLLGNNSNNRWTQKKYNHH